MSHIKKHNRLMVLVTENIDLAWNYASDGALHSAADCLQKAARHMKTAAEEKDRAMAKLMASADRAGA